MPSIDWGSEVTPKLHEYQFAGGRKLIETFAATLHEARPIGFHGLAPAWEADAIVIDIRRGSLHRTRGAGCKTKLGLGPQSYR